MCGRNKNISELVHNFKYFINLKISALVKYYLSSRGGGKKTQTTLQTVFENHNTRVKQVATKKGYYSHFKC